jgi:hypothetical protein
VARAIKTVKIITEGHGMGFILNRGQRNPSASTTAMVKIKGLPKNMRDITEKLATAIINSVMSHASGLFKKNSGTMQNRIKRNTIENTTRLSTEEPVIL